MPRKPAITREEIVDGAFRFIRTRGFGSLTARNLAKELGCSTQPIMYQFPNLAELKECAYKKADEYHSEYILRSDDLVEIGLRYISFAYEEPFLFRFLFQSGHFDGTDLDEMICDPAAGGLIGRVRDELNVSGTKAEEIFKTLFIMVHGYASLIANNAIPYDRSEIEKILVSVGQELLGKKDIDQ